MLTYDTVMGTGSTSYKVKLDGKHIGNIKQAKKGDDSAGWYYQSKGSKLKGNTMPTVRDVKRSLELPSD